MDRGLELLDHPDELYRRSTDEGRRLLNQGIFEKLLIGHDGTVEGELREPFAEIIEAHDTFTNENRSCVRTGSLQNRQNVPGPAYRPARDTQAGLLVTALMDEGSSKTAMVALMSRLSDSGTALALARSSYDGVGPSHEATPVKRVRHYQRRLTPEQVGDLMAARRSGLTMVELAERFGVTRQTVSKWLHRRGQPD